MTPGSARRRAGFTLIEMSTVMFGLAVVLAAGTAVLWTALQSGRAGGTSFQRVQWRSALADEFRADVAGSDTAPDRLGDLAAGPDCLILHRPKAGRTRYVVYQRRDGKLVRVEREKDADGFPRPTPTGTAVAEFLRPTGDRPVLTLRLTETPRGGPPRHSEITAALGGDLR